MYKVFINDRLIYFTNNSENYSQIGNCLILNFFMPNITSFIVDLLLHGKKTDVVVISVEDEKEAFMQFKSQFKTIEAAGGLVQNNKSEKLFIYRLDKWDLPKGKIEEGENREEGALREVEEECGINDLTIIKELTPTYHIYLLKNEVILKKTHWFEMESNFTEKLAPQTIENITKAEWLNDYEIKEKVLKNTYSSIEDLLKVSAYL